VVFLVVSTCSPQPPPPSHPNVSWRWFFWSFQHIHPNHHLPRIQMQAGGGFFFSVSTCLPPLPPPSCSNMSWRWFFSFFQHLCHHHLPCIQMRARGGYFQHFNMPPTTITSLTSKCELEVVIFGGFNAAPTTTFQGICHCCHIITTPESTMVKMDRRRG